MNMFQDEETKMRDEARHKLQKEAEQRQRLFVLAQRVGNDLNAWVGAKFPGAFEVTPPRENNNIVAIVQLENKERLEIVARGDEDYQILLNGSPQSPPTTAAGMKRIVLNWLQSGVAKVTP